MAHLKKKKKTLQSTGFFAKNFYSRDRQSNLCDHPGLESPRLLGDPEGKKIGAYTRKLILFSSPTTAHVELPNWANVVLPRQKRSK